MSNKKEIPFPHSAILEEADEAASPVDLLVSKIKEVHGTIIEKELEADKDFSEFGKPYFDGRSYGFSYCSELLKRLLESC